MDETSKEMLKRDVFVQGLLLKWQKKVLPFASTFSDALPQARAAEQQERQLSRIHPPPKPTPKSRTVPDLKTPSAHVTEPVREWKPSGRPKRDFKCFECGSTSHKWRDCPLRKPTETPGKVRDASTKTVTPTAEALDQKCARLQQEWFDAEFARMSRGYEGAVSVVQAVGAVGPLCYTTVEVEGQEVNAMVDTGSSATILSFELFKRIGKNANIPVTALSRPDIVLRDYNKRPIPVGAKVELTFQFGGRSVTAPVYVRSSDGEELETCLLGTNVIFPLGLMQPAAGVCHQEDGQASTGSVCLVQSRRVPARMGTYLDVQVKGQFDSDAPLLFEPDRDWPSMWGWKWKTPSSPLTLMVL